MPTARRFPSEISDETRAPDLKVSTVSTMPTLSTIPQCQLLVGFLRKISDETRAPDLNVSTLSTINHSAPRVPSAPKKTNANYFFIEK
jgi:hypothetical protein